jgi:hypothetical protein
MDWSSIGSFLNHGVHHVLEGWDHLLFAAALVLALSSFWEVFKVIGVFTVAHSITVTWTALRGAPVLPPSIVEPVIAGSIVVVALENLLRRDAHLTARRLGVAFVFGFGHGMGLGGALLENLKDLPAGAAGWAIAAFCVGVEIGHLCVVAPLSGVLKIGRDLGQERFRQGVLRWGSLVIAAGGVWYLAAALGWLPGPGGE